MCLRLPAYLQIHRGSASGCLPPDRARSSSFLQRSLTRSGREPALCLTLRTLLIGLLTCFGISRIMPLLAYRFRASGEVAVQASVSTGGVSDILIAEDASSGLVSKCRLCLRGRYVSGTDPMVMPAPI